MPIYRNGSDFSGVDNGGVSLAEQIGRLIPPKRGKGRLPPAPTREAIGVAKSEAVPAGADPSSASGIVGPLTEQVYAGSTYYYQTSSDGLFVIEFADYTDYHDADLTILRFNHRDPNA